MILPLHTFAATSNIDEALSHIIQLIILCIPLFILPGLIKGSSQIMGKIGSAADRFNQGALKRGGGIAKKTPGIRSGIEMANDFKAGRDERYKKGVATRQASRSQRGYGRAIGGGFRATNRDAAQARGRSVLDSLESEEMKAQQVLLNSNSSVNDNPVALRDELISELGKGNGANGAKVRAYHKRLSELSPSDVADVYGRVGSTTTGTARTALERAHSDGYGDLAKKRADIAGNWDFDSGGIADTTKTVSDAQLATQKAAGMANLNVGHEQASRVLASPNSDLGAAERTYLEGVVAAGPTPPPTPGPTPTPPPTPGPGPTPRPTPTPPPGSTPAPTNTGIPHGPQPAPAGYGGGGSPTPPPTPGSTSPGGVVIPSADETRRFGG